MVALLFHFYALLELAPNWKNLFFSDPLLLVPPLRHSFCVPQKPEISATKPEEFARELRQAVDLLPSRIDIDAKSVEQGLAKLVLTLIEFIRRLLEAQALRRMEQRPKGYAWSTLARAVTCFESSASGWLSVRPTGSRWEA